MKETPNNLFKCEDCDSEFPQRFKLELHMMKDHKQDKIYKCKDCEAGFVFKWRLKKHMKAHTQTKIRSCHYFNNNKECPFSEVGCKFSHQLTTQCKFGQGCRIRLCQFQHC